MNHLPPHYEHGFGGQGGEQRGQNALYIPVELLYYGLGIGHF